MEHHNLSFETDYIVDTGSIHFTAGDTLHKFGACNNCHFYGIELPKQGPETWAPNLALSKVRLRPDWITMWLDDPSVIMPGTKMPAPYIPDSNALSLNNAIETWGESIMELDGDRMKMLEGLRDYILNIPGEINIDEVVKSYFKDNGYHFDADDEDEDFEEDEEW